MIDRTAQCGPNCIHFDWTFTETRGKNKNDRVASPESAFRRKFMEFFIISLALSLLIMNHLVIGQRQKAPNFLAFHWSPHGSLISIGQHFITTYIYRKEQA